MKKILTVTILFISAFRLQATGSQDLEEIIKTIIDSNSYSNENKITPAAKTEPDVSAVEDSAERSKEGTNKSISFPSADEALLKSGIQLFEASLYENSKQKLEELKTKYPDSPYRDIASIWLSKDIH